MGGFFRAFFDLSFQKFITLKVVKVIYVIGLIIIALFTAFGIYVTLTLGVRGYGFSSQGYLAFIQNVPLRLLAIIGMAFLYAIFFRMSLEFLVSVLRIAKNTGDMADMMKAEEPEEAIEPEDPDPYPSET